VPPASVELKLSDVIATASTIPVHLDRGLWKVFSRGAVILPRQSWPNEAARNKGWVGSVVHTGAIVESFLNAYHSLAPWDQYHDPDYFDKLLISPSKKPKRLVYKLSGALGRESENGEE